MKNVTTNFRLYRLTSHIGKPTRKSGHEIIHYSLQKLTLDYHVSIIEAFLSYYLTFYFIYILEVIHTYSYNFSEIVNIIRK